MIELKIDHEFESLIPKLTDEEFKQLKENILDDGEVLTPIITWQGIIIDGHNRWRIIQDNPGIPYKTHELIFLDRNQAKEWIIKNQLGRRNITNEQRLRLIGQMQENRKKSVGGQVNNTNAEKRIVQNEPIVSTKSTAAQIAEEVGVSESTVKRAEKFSKGIDAIQEVSPDAANRILHGKSNVTQKAVMSVPAMSHEEKKEFVEEVLHPVPKEEKKSEPFVYTIDTLIQEIEGGSESYLKFLRSTLVMRSTYYAEQEDRKKVYKAITSIKEEIIKIQNLIGG